MSPELVGIIAILILIGTLLLRVWIGLAMALVGFFGFWYLMNFEAAAELLVVVPYRVLSDHNLSVIPLFILMGVLVSKTGISKDLYKAANAWIGPVKGGLAMATCVACAAFAAICGTSLAGTVTMAQIAVPEMRKFHYKESLSSASVVAGGTLGILIPPSLGFIMYAILTEESVGMLFMAGFLPGILMVVLFMIAIFFLTIIDPNIAPPGPKADVAQKLTSLKHTWTMIALFVLVMGGIYGGIFTPTEAGAVGAFGAMVICALKGQLNLKTLLDSLTDTVKTTGMIVTIVLGAFIFMRFLTITHLPFAMAETINSVSLPRYAILAIIIIIYILLGMILDIIAAITLTVPIVHPTIVALGFDPVWYGVVMVIVMEMGMITPPIGINVFVLSGITGTPVSDVFRGVWPFVAAMLACIIILTIFPQIALFLPSLM